jgi:cytochrome c5
MSANEAAHDTSHESLIKTPQQLIVVMVLAFVVPVVLLIMLAKFVISTSPTDAASAPAETVASRIKPVVDVNNAATFNLAAGGGGARAGEEIVQSVCSACHASGAAGAPKIGDKGAWAPRIGKGLAGLLQTAIKGKGAMPPRGGASDLTDFELSRAIVYMANQSGGSLKEPAEPAAAKAAPKK